MKILILGSMSFSPEMKEIGEELQKKRHEIRLPEFIEEYTSCTSREEMHKQAVINKLSNNLYKKYHELIKETDAILIINKTKKEIEGYIGANTLIEMAFAKALDKKIFLLHQIPEMEYTDEIKASTPIILNGNLEEIK
jgi:nucleoside 2-deoxyribosyltransferase